MAIYVNDVGTQLIATFKRPDGQPRDISNATLKQLRLKKPNGTIVYKPAEFVMDGANGQVIYTFVEGDVDQSGSWEVQGYIETLSGRWHSGVVVFPVSISIELRQISASASKTLDGISRLIQGTVS